MSNIETHVLFDTLQTIESYLSTTYNLNTSNLLSPEVNSFELKELEL